jgi:hypothetical protein
MPDLLNITFGFVPNEKEVEAINAAFDGSIDWVRYDLLPLNAPAFG